MVKSAMAAEDGEDFEERLAYTFAQMGGGAEAINYMQLWKWITVQMRADADLDVKGVTEEMQKAATDAFAKHKRDSDDLLGKEEVADLLRELDLLKYIPEQVPETDLFQNTTGMEGADGLPGGGLIDTSRSGLMRSSQFRSAFGVDDGVLRSSCLMKSVVYAESPEQTVLRIREEREELKWLLQQAEEFHLRMLAKLEETEGQNELYAEQVDDLSTEMSDLSMEIEARDIRIKEVLRAFEEVDERYRQLQIERDNDTAEGSQESEPEGDVTASGTFLTKSQGLMQLATEKEHQAAEAEAKAREKQKLVIELATELDSTKREVEQLLIKNEQEIKERQEQNVSSRVALRIVVSWNSLMKQLLALAG